MHQQYPATRSKRAYTAVANSGRVNQWCFHSANPITVCTLVVCLSLRAGLTMHDCWERTTGTEPCNYWHWGHSTDQPDSTLKALKVSVCVCVCVCVCMCVSLLMVFSPGQRTQHTS